MAKYLLRPHENSQGHDGATVRPRSRNPLINFQRGFEAGFERIRSGYHALLVMALGRRPVFISGFLLFVIGSFALVPYLGRDFFPSVDEIARASVRYRVCRSV